MKLEDLKESFSQDIFLKLNEQLIEEDFKPSQLSISPDDPKFITNTKYYGIYSGLDLHIFTVEHSSTEDARVGVSLDIFKLMKKYSFQNALIAAHSKSSDSWRYSLVTSNLSVSSAGKIAREFSNPRRHSFVLGPNQKVLTPYKQLIQSNKVSDIKELSKKFSLEVVNNEFYKEIAKLYDELVGTDKIVRKLIYPTTDDESHEFAVRLIGRIIFCWFLREKKSKAGLSLVSNRVLSRDAADETNYYHNVLAPLFFEILNKPISKRSDKFKIGAYAKIPYLNGGLFSDDAIDNYRFDTTLELSIPGLVDVPDLWLRNLFDLLERFNFTVDENTSYDTDLSIDPEMLGRVFENLLARINPETGETVRKSTGSFYTPREIVEYMVDSSLSGYLVSKTDVDRKKIEALVSYDLFDDAGNELNDDENISILEALSILTVLDPACGSGAFPIGMLQKIVFIISQLDPKAEWWLGKQLEGASPELRKEFANRSVDYIRKLGIIRQTIFGVDIQPIATEISRLRCFLTLIVDEAVDDSQENRGIRPLPNLDFKFVTANTLIPLPEAQNQQVALIEDKSSIRELKELRDEYFTASIAEREKLQTKFHSIQNNMLRWILDVSRGRDQSLMTSALTEWNPFSNKSTKWYDSEWMFGIEGGFDIVIGNPPYSLKLADAYKDRLRDIYKTLHFKINLFACFIERGTFLSKENGHLTYIVPSLLFTNDSLKKLRHYLLKETEILRLLNLGDGMFENVTMPTMVFLLKNRPKLGTKIKVYPNVNGLEDLQEGHLVDQSSYLDAYNYVWGTATNEISKLLKKIHDDTKELGDVLHVNQGIITGNDSEYLSENHATGEWKPTIRGRDIAAYRSTKPNLFVKYVRYELACPRDEKIFDCPEKILIRRTADRPIASFDDQRLYNLHTLYSCRSKDTHTYSLKYLLALLNSNLFEFVYKQKLGTEVGRIFAEIKIVYIRQLPVKTPSSSTKNEIERLVDIILLADDSSKEYSLSIDAIDALVYELYDLGSAEISLIESQK